jgi:GT2 family glycosyltransferase
LRRVDAAVVTWNSAATLEACLESLAASKGVEVIIHVVDNDSTDETKQMLANWQDSVDVVFSDKNLGFPIATNMGAARGEAEFVLLVNPDVIVMPDAIDACIRALDQAAERWAVGPRVLLPSGTIQLECARNFPSLWTTFCKSTRLDRLFAGSAVFDRELIPSWDHVGSRNVPCISGAFMLLTRERWEALGGLDEQIFMYYEDLDMCARIAEERGEIWYESAAEIIHYGRVSSSQSDRDLDRLGWETRIRFFAEHRGRGAALAGRQILALQAVVGMLISPLAAARGDDGLRSGLGRRLRNNFGLLRWAWGRRERED